MTLTEVEHIKPGKRLGDFRYGRMPVQEAELTVGVLPPESDAEKAYVARGSMNQAIGTVALEHIEDGHAELGIDIPTNDPLLARGMVREAMARNHLTHGILDPAKVEMQPAELREAGFQPDASSDNYIFSGV